MLTACPAYTRVGDSYAVSGETSESNGGDVRSLSRISRLRRQLIVAAAARLAVGFLTGPARVRVILSPRS